jgi:hypothetical protein
VAARHGQCLSGDVLGGLSQGGHAAMAFGQVMQREPDLRLRAPATISGPYELAGTDIPVLFDNRWTFADGTYLTFGC